MVCTKNKFFSEQVVPKLSDKGHNCKQLVSGCAISGLVYVQFLEGIS